MNNCIDCGAALSEYNAYRRKQSKSGLYHRCKNCHHIKCRESRSNRLQGITDGIKSGRIAEEITANFLNSRRIPTILHDGNSDYDILAWGCVRIEVKSSNIRENKIGKPLYIFSFGKSDFITKSDIIALVTIPNSNIYLFSSDDDSFCHQRNNPKTSVIWQPESAKDNRYLGGLSDEKMQLAFERVELIETKRLEWGKA